MTTLELGPLTQSSDAFPVGFRSHLRSEAGQVTILFMGITLSLVLFLVLAVNVGMQVRQKVELQNASDAVAFSAATQQSVGLNAITRWNREIRDLYLDLVDDLARGNYSPGVFRTFADGIHLIAIYVSETDYIRDTVIENINYDLATLSVIQEATSRNYPRARADLVSGYKQSIADPTRLSPRIVALAGGGLHEPRNEEVSFRYCVDLPKCQVISTYVTRVETWYVKYSNRTSFAWIRLTDEEPPPYFFANRIRAAPPILQAESLATPYGGNIGEFLPYYRAKLVRIDHQRLLFDGRIPHPVFTIYDQGPLAFPFRLTAWVSESDRLLRKH